MKRGRLAVAHCGSCRQRRSDLTSGVGRDGRAVAAVHLHEKPARGDGRDPLPLRAVPPLREQSGFLLLHRFGVELWWALCFFFFFLLILLTRVTCLQSSRITTEQRERVSRTVVSFMSSSSIPS